MSLFPSAITIVQEVTKSEKVNDQRSWLQNDSYETPISVPANDPIVKSKELIATVFDHEPKTTSKENDKKLKKKKSKHKKHKKSQDAGKLHDIENLQKKKNSKDKGLTVYGKKCAIVEELTKSQVYFSDNSGDKDNIHFQKPYKVALPKFYRPIVRCIGTPLYGDIFIGESRKIKLEKHSHNEERYFSKRNRKLVNSGDVQHFYRDIRNTTFDKNILQYDYLKLFDHNNDSSMNNDADEMRDRGILNSKVERLNKAVRENPGNIESWLELVKSQDEVIEIGLQNRGNILIEKKIAILDRGIEENKTNVNLRILRLELKAKIATDYSLIDQEWQNLVFKFSDNLDVWDNFIQYMTMHSTVKFTVRKTEKSFFRCISVLRAMQQGSFKTTSSIKTVEENIIKISKQYFDFLVNCGHIEKCIISLIYLLELNFRPPKITNESFATQLSSLEKFYDSNEKKLGEENSTGWGLWYTKYTKGGWISEEGTETPVNDQDSMMEIEESLISPSNNMAQNWFLIENHRHLQAKKLNNIHNLSKSTHENHIKFNAIAGSLFKLSNLNFKIEIIRTFLHILETPINYRTTNEPMFDKHGVYAWTDSDQILGKNLDNIWLHKPLLHPSGNYKNREGVNKMVLPRDGDHAFILDAFEQLIINNKANTEMKDVLMIELMEYLENRVLALSSLKNSELKRTVKEAKKTAKYILKQNPNSFSVWGKLCCIEWVSENYAESCRILKQTIQLSCEQLSKVSIKTIIKSKIISGILSICRPVAELCCQTHMTNKCTLPDSIIANVVYTLGGIGNNFQFEKIDKEKFTPTEVLKISMGYEKLTEELKSEYSTSSEQSNSFYTTYCDAAICCVIFNVLINNLDTAFKVLENAANFLQTQKRFCNVDADLEHMLILKTFLISKYEITRKDARKFLYSSSQSFHNNVLFAECLSEIDSASYLSANLRRHFTQICKAGFVAPWLFSINFETKRLNQLAIISDQNSQVNEAAVFENGIENQTLDNAFGSKTDHRLQNVFSNAVSNTPNPALWRMYLAHSAATPGVDTSHIYYKAIDSCPWSRLIYLDYININPQELQNVINEMEDKGLTVRTSTEEIELLMME